MIFPIDYTLPAINNALRTATLVPGQKAVKLSTGQTISLNVFITMVFVCRTDEDKSEYCQAVQKLQELIKEAGPVQKSLWQCVAHFFASCACTEDCRQAYREQYILQERL